MSQQGNRYYEFGEFRLDAHKRVLLKNNEPIHLTHKIFEVLLVLIENSGRVLEKEELMQRVWEGTIVEEANLKNSISTLRKALGEERGASHYIQTLPKRGYKFIAPVIALPDEDETYLIEKRTTKEVIIDAVGDDGSLMALDSLQQHLEAGSISFTEELPAVEYDGRDSQRKATRVAGERPAPQLLTDKVSFLKRLMHRPFAVAFGAVILLIAIT